MGRVIAIDPGKHLIAWAVFGDRSLCNAGLLRETKEVDFTAGTRNRVLALSVLAPFEAVIVELPRVYPKERTVRPNDLIDLATVSGACSTLGPCVFVPPQKWKGQVPKRIQNTRTRAMLTPKETEILDRNLAPVAPSLRHNVIDAVGIGLWFFGRGKP